ncbi:hypothetical protein DPMN_005120 [Dreissena polymorpha]|uniref:Uncharacterized protein n=1 Tax=Dreissena polymorpha TaxID=45954 RepID=A0A9D4MP23_DREPO|nr:hypothetical protein DPMN_005120 [Dreissena polymorpha]
MNILIKFHEDWTITVASRVKNAPPLGSHVFQAKVIIFELIQDIIGTNLLSNVNNKTAPPPGDHVFSPICTIFKFVRDINEINVLTKFHDDWAKIVTSRVFTMNTATPSGGHIFQRTGTIFELNQHIILTNILTKLHEDWASNVTSTVFTRIFFFDQHDPVSNSVEFHEDRTINVASRVFTRQNVDAARRTTDDGQKAITKAHHEHVVLR